MPDTCEDWARCTETTEVVVLSFPCLAVTSKHSTRRTMSWSGPEGEEDIRCSLVSHCHFKLSYFYFLHSFPLFKIFFFFSLSRQFDTSLQESRSGSFPQSQSQLTVWWASCWIISTNRTNSQSQSFKVWAAEYNMRLNTSEYIFCMASSP